MVTLSIHRKHKAKKAPVLLEPGLFKATIRWKRGFPLSLQTSIGILHHLCFLTHPNGGKTTNEHMLPLTNYSGKGLSQLFLNYFSSLCFSQRRACAPLTAVTVAIYLDCSYTGAFVNGSEDSLKARRTSGKKLNRGTERLLPTRTCTDPFPTLWAVC
ncbi:MAG: hypothetical protein ACOYM3_28525 [Terrimicrobiaceae bacterium]